MNKVNSFSQVRYFYINRGVTLIELLIALIIGIFLLGGLFAVFQSNQQSYRSKMELDNAQETFRYMSHTINRLTKAATRVVEAASDSELLLELVAGDGLKNCIGQNVTSTQINRIYLEDGDIKCSVSASLGEVLVSGVSNINFSYGSRDSDNRVSIYKQEDTLSGAEWDDVFSVLVDITMESGLNTQFVSSMRAQVTSDLIIVRPDTPPTPPTNGGSGDGSEGEGSGSNGEGSDPNDGGSGDGETSPGDDSSGNDNGSGVGGCTNVEIACTCHYQNARQGASLVNSKSDVRCGSVTNLCNNNIPAGIGNNNEFPVLYEICE